MSNTSAQIRTYKEALSATGVASGETNVVYGTRDDVHQFAADVDIVVFGVAKNVNAYQIATYTERHGIKVLNCELITTWTEARSNSFKVTIKAYQTERALSNEIWPYGVGVRRFRNQKGSARNKNSSNMEKQSKDRKSKRDNNQGMTGNTGGQKNVSRNTFNNKRELSDFRNAQLA